MNFLMIRDWWATYRTTLLLVAIGLMAVAAVHRLGDQFDRLLWESGQGGAIDLKQRHEEVRQWFAGKLVYQQLGTAVYPPASYVILWPLLGWLSVTPARWLWALSSTAMLGWLVYLTARESSASTPLERMAIVLLPLSMYATSATIGNGQLIVHILPALLYSLTSPAHPSGWRQDVVSAALVVAALVSPTIAAPFFWIVLFVPGRLRSGFSCGRRLPAAHAARALVSRGCTNRGCPRLVEPRRGRSGLGSGDGRLCQPQHVDGSPARTGPEPVRVLAHVGGLGHVGLLPPPCGAVVAAGGLGNCGASLGLSPAVRRSSYSRADDCTATYCPGGDPLPTVMTW